MPRSPRKVRRDSLNRRIASSYAVHNDADVSTDCLLQMVSDDCGVDVGRVIDGLIAVGVFQPKEAAQA